MYSRPKNRCSECSWITRSAMLSFSNNFLQQYIHLAKRLFLVSDSMIRRISNALNSYFGLLAIHWMCLFDLLIVLCEFVTKLFSCLSKSRRVSCLLFDLSRVQLFWQRSRVTRELKVTAFCVTSFYRIFGDLNPTLVQNLFSTQWICHANLTSSNFWSQTVTL